MDFALNHPELILVAAWYVLSAVASEMPLPKKDSSLLYKGAFHTVQIVTGALARARAGRKNGK